MNTKMSVAKARRFLEVPPLTGVEELHDAVADKISAAMLRYTTARRIAKRRIQRRKVIRKITSVFK